MWNTPTSIFYGEICIDAGCCCWRFCQLIQFFFCCRFCCHRCCCRYWQCLRPLHAMPWLCQPCNVSCCIWKELSEYTNEEYENEEICIVNCRFFVCFILFVLTMFSLLFFTCTHFMFFLRVFYIFSIFIGINVKKNCGRCMPCIIFFPTIHRAQHILWIILNFCL